MPKDKAANKRTSKAKAATAGAENGNGAAAEAPPVMTEMKTDAQGQPYIPGAGPLVIEELVNKGLEIVADKKLHAELTNRLKAHKPEISRLCKKYEEYFSADDEADGVKWYRAGGVKIKYTHSEEDDVTVTEDAKTVNVAAEY